ncbi:DUF397 domain-containing protein [Streptomyces sp. WAC05374]|uniref:DUF397 domain-containing protein n=1 Tax=Streptomyces sp. WAC05374 TaxID=2487420 RepID=UPI000F898B05|nr:DUF397 domain-containing protein [Streptomyces sp. WAC05374]RST07612.1 DUF397 domain-containing protein [Streptomyces sp. WAC05374]TDF44328.1 DUF397 domain-containing protein [Streptomyces sp. WAC05374]TDF53742.1 DUF397 domain-containing protein [Streptomyces sp. WAC05374]TDF58575.1 DUF397 domain-containing protein [Streptomyces sp. WAC05374]
MTHPSDIGSTPLVWFTSSYSNGSGGECVECARTGAGMLVRDSKRDGGAAVAVSAEAWSVFVGWAHARQRSTAS